MNVSPQIVAEYAHNQAAVIRASRPYKQASQPLPGDWAGWLETVFASYISSPYAEYHKEFWKWVWRVEAGEGIAPFVAAWPRGFGKSTAVEIATAMLGARKKRTYALYVCSSQEQADTHVQNVAGMLESPSFAKHFPATARRKVGKFGNPSGWRRNRLRTESGFTIDALGLDTAARGAKIDESRPDLIIFDDVDELLDSPATVNKKEQLITKSIIPAGVPGKTAILVAQNLIHEDGIVARLCNGTAKYLANRIVSGPHPAIENLVTEDRDGKTVIVSGESTWDGRSLESLQAEIDDLGISAFLAECQHDVTILEGGIFGHVNFQRCALDAVPVLEDIQVWVDPAVTDTKKSDAHGIQADGRGVDGKLYRLYSWEDRTSPEDSLRRAILKARELGASCVGVETDQGGDTWESTYELTWRKLVDDEVIPATEKAIKFRQEKAGTIGSKTMRATQMLSSYERGEIVHVLSGTHETLERGLKRYLIRKPYDLVDACLVAGTLVETDRGLIPIERIQIGDMVATRVGYKRVQSCGMTSRSAPILNVVFSDGRSLVGTANHPVFTVENGWVPLGEVLGLHGIIHVCPVQSVQSKSNTTGGFIGGIRTRSNERIASITSPLVRALGWRRRSIGKSGSIATAQSLKAITFITTTMTRSTMIPAILCASPSCSIEQGIAKGSSRLGGPRRNSGTSNAFAKKPPSGTLATKGLNGTESMANEPGKGSQTASAHARCVDQNSSRGATSDQRFVRLSVETKRVKLSRAISRITPAKSVGRCSRPPDIDQDEFAHLSVVDISTAGNDRVYNLSVEGQPEYFANGVLVHNCYWAYRGLMQRKVRKPIGAVAIGHATNWVVR